MRAPALKREIQSMFAVFFHDCSSIASQAPRAVGRDRALAPRGPPNVKQCQAMGWTGRLSPMASMPRTMQLNALAKRDS